MKRHAPHTELSESPHSAPSQRQHLPVPRAPHSSEIIYFKGNPNSWSADEALSSKAAKVEWMWQLERDSIVPYAASTLIPSGDEGVSVVTSNGTRPYFHGQTAPDPAHPAEQSRREPSAQFHEQEMEIGYEDDHPSSTLGSLEEKFFDEVMQLVKEQNDAADSENTRHQERIVEINSHYLDKLSSLRAQQANRRKDFLLKEQRERLRQHEEVPLTVQPLPSMTYQAKDARDIDPITFNPVSRELLAHRSYPTGLQDLYRDPPYYPSSRGAQTQGTETRVPLPAGRVYNTSSRYQ